MLRFDDSVVVVRLGGSGDNMTPKDHLSYAGVDVGLQQVGVHLL
jgi:hypothetical protein